MSRKFKHEYLPPILNIYHYNTIRLIFGLSSAPCPPNIKRATHVKHFIRVPIPPTSFYSPPNGSPKRFTFFHFPPLHTADTVHIQFDITCAVREHFNSYWVCKAPPELDMCLCKWSILRVERKWGVLLNRKNVFVTNLKSFL